jgi:hypothetical protein
MRTLFTAAGTLYLNPTTYQTGGTVVGRSAAHFARLGYQTQVLTQPSTFLTPTNVRRLSAEGAFVFSLYDLTPQAFSLLAYGKALEDNVWTPGKMSGKVLPDAELFDLIIRPDHVWKPAVRIYRGAVIDVGPVVYARDAFMIAETTITVIALDSEHGPFRFGPLEKMLEPEED